MTSRAGLLALAAALGAALAGGGCSAWTAGRLDNPATFTDTPADRAEEAARQVLMDLRFDIEIPEASEGRLATMPLTGASWFEFWRHDTIGTMQRAESSIHTIRRRALVTISPKDGGSQVFVKVDKQRKSAPGTGPGTISETYNLYDTEETDLVRQNELEPVSYEWVDLGRDRLLEQHILERIHARLK